MTDKTPISPSVNLPPDLARGTAYLKAEVRKLGAEDVMICLSLRPYATQTLALAKAGVTASTYIIAITDSPHSPLAMLADEVLLGATANQHFFPSQLGALYLFETIIGLMVAKSGNTVQDNLRKIESFSINHGEYHEWRYCLLYTSPSPRDQRGSRMPSSA